jgi:hypothetical protein
MTRISPNPPNRPQPAAEGAAVALLDITLSFTNSWSAEEAGAGAQGRRPRGLLEQEIRNRRRPGCGHHLGDIDLALG